MALTTILAPHAPFTVVLKKEIIGIFNRAVWKPGAGRGMHPSKTNYRNTDLKKKTRKNN